MIPFSKTQAAGGAAALMLFALSATAQAAETPEGAKLAQQYACTACHGIEKAIVGPSYRDVAKKYADDKAALATLTAKARAGGSGVWGAVPMPPNAHVPEADVQKIVGWILAGAPSQ